MNVSLDKYTTSFELSKLQSYLHFITNPKSMFGYSATPQSYTILPATLSVIVGKTLTINGKIGGSLNVYQWYKGGDIIVGAKSATFTKKNIKATDIGAYQCEVTSTFVGAGSAKDVKITSTSVVVTMP